MIKSGRSFSQAEGLSDAGINKEIMILNGVLSEQGDEDRRITGGE